MAEKPIPDLLERLPDLAELRAAGNELRTRMIADYICRELERFLDVPPAHRLSTSRPLRTQGVGSITALKLRRMLELALRIDVQATDLLRDDTVEEVAALLAGRLGPVTGPGARLAGAGVHRP